MIEPSHLSKNKGEGVLLSCETDDLVDANPRCDRYIWDKINKNDHDDNRIIVSNKSRDSRWLNIFMSEKFEGKYRCKCANDFGESEFSDVAVLWLRNTTSASELFGVFQQYANVSHIKSLYSVRFYKIKFFWELWSFFEICSKILW